MSDEENKGFKVTDRRANASEEDPPVDAADAPAAEAGDGSADAAEDAPAGEVPAADTGTEADAGAAADTGTEADAGAAADTGTEADAGAAADGAGGDPSPGEAIPLTFATFIMSLGESAMVHLGVVPNPATGQVQADLRSARQTIDILGILEEKTRGNLVEEEGKLLAGLLYTLRMQYVEAESASG